MLEHSIQIIVQFVDSSVPFAKYTQLYLFSIPIKVSVFSCIWRTKLSEYMLVYFRILFPLLNKYHQRFYPIKTHKFSYGSIKQYSTTHEQKPYLKPGSPHPSYQSHLITLSNMLQGYTSSKSTRICRQLHSHRTWQFRHTRSCRKPSSRTWSLQTAKTTNRARRSQQSPSW